MSSKLKGFAAGILAAIFYGTNPLGALPLYAEGITAGNVLFYRYGLAALLFALWLLCRRESFAIKRGHAVKLAVLGVLFGLSSVMLFVSFHFMNAGIASTILFSYPIMTALLMVIFYREHITGTTVLSLLLALSGIALLYRGEGGQTLSLTGVMLVLASSLLYALYIVYVHQFQAQISGVKFTFWVILFGFFTISGYMLFVGDSLQLLHGWTQWGCAVQLAVLPTVLSLFFMNVAIKEVGSTSSSILGALEPVTAVVISTFVFGEDFTPRLALGILLILSAVILIILRKG